MEISFNDGPGMIFDLFQSLWIISNIDENERIKEEYGIYKKNEFEQEIINISEGNIIEMDKVQRYFHKEMSPERLLGMAEIWETNSIENYLNHIRNMSEIDHVQRIYDTIMAIVGDISKRQKKSDGLKEEVIKLLVDGNISVGLKWEMFLFLRDTKEYMVEYLDFIDKYLELYEKLSTKREKVLKTYNRDFKANIEDGGLEFLKKEIGHTFNFQGVEEVRITTTALVGLRILEEEGIYYVIIGPYIKKSLANMYSEDEIEKNLNFIRGISESTRFKMIQLLLKRDYYGQEIVDNLNMNKATVFYHLDYLLALNIVKLSRESQKNYYSLNKNEIIRNLDMFASRFE